MKLGSNENDYSCVLFELFVVFQASVKDTPSPLNNSTAYPSGLLKEELPELQIKPWYRDSGLDCITKNNQATESAISYA